MSEGRKENKYVLTHVLETAIPYTLRAVTPLHPGSGARVSGIVDLAVQREAHTNLPVIYGSSLKGALKAWAQSMSELTGDKIVEIFGPPPGEGSEGMGKAIFLDAKLLLMPVRSLKGTYGWITSPFVINRFIEDIEVFSYLSKPKLGGTERLKISGKIEGEPAPDQAWLKTAAGPLTINIEGRNIVIVEDAKLDVIEKFDVFSFLEMLGDDLRKRLGNRILITNHDTFKRILERAMMISPHIVINPSTGTVSNLWFQEDLPPETVLYSAVITSADLKSDIEELLKGVIHVGGDITTGLGFAEVTKISLGGGGGK